MKRHEFFRLGSVFASFPGSTKKKPRQWACEAFKLLLVYLVIGKTDHRETFVLFLALMNQQRKFSWCFA